MWWKVNNYIILKYVVNLLMIIRLVINFLDFYYNIDSNWWYIYIFYIKYRDYIFYFVLIILFEYFELFYKIYGLIICWFLFIVNIYLLGKLWIVISNKRIIEN